MAIKPVGFCAECYGAFIAELQATGSSSIVYEFPEFADIEQHLESNFDPVTGMGHHLGATFVWDPAYVPPDPQEQPENGAEPDPED